MSKYYIIVIPDPIKRRKESELYSEEVWLAVTGKRRDLDE